MWELQRRKKLRALMYSKITLIVLFILTFFIARSTWGVYVKSRDSARAATAAATEANSLLSRKKNLIEENNRLETVAGQEEQFRLKYSVAKPGEEMYIIVDKKASDTEIKSPKNPSWWSRIKDFFW